MNLSNSALHVSRAIKRFKLLHKIGRRVYCLFRPGMRFQIERTFRRHKDIFVLKIGANDGVESDPLADFLLGDSRYRGVMVEPVPHYAKMLAKNYQSTGRFRIEQAAIAGQSRDMTMYHVAENAAEIVGKPVPDWLRGVASLDRNHVLKHMSPEMHGAVSETVVACLTVKDLLARNQITAIDLLQIDAEGFDWVVLQQFDFKTIRPQVVIFERKHLAVSDQEAAQQHMQKAGYLVKPMETDFFCTLA
ncbi:MAG TPA: FkbM family methyltransferase [Verrucomicrobiae bacterium]